MGYKDRFLPGEFPESGAIFMCNSRTKEQCLKGKLFGLPSNMTDLVLNVRKRMTLFLFEYESRLLHGVFHATSDGGINIDPEAFCSSGKHFPAQVRFTTVMRCIPLEEYEFKYVIRDNYFSGNKFRFGLNEKQVRKLLNLFWSKEIFKKHPERRGDARSDRYRKNLFRNRLRSIKKEDREFEGEDSKKIDDGVMKEKTKGEHDVENRYIPIFTKPYEKHYGENAVGRNNEKVRMDGMSCNRIRFQDEYNVSEGFRKSPSYHLGHSCDKRSQTVTDKYLFSHETVESEQKTLNEHLLSKTNYDGSCTVRPITLTEHTFSKQRETFFGPKPNDDDDGSFRFRSFAPTTYSSIGEPVLTHDYSSHFSQNAYSTSCDPTRIEAPEIRFSPSHFADGSSFIPFDNSQFYPSSEKIPTILPLSKLPPYHSHNEGSIRYFDDLDYASLGKRQHIVEGNQEVREFKTVSREGSYNPLFPEFISKKLTSSDAGLSLCEDNSVENDKRFCQARERKHLFGTDKRVSVFARLNWALRHGNLESETDKKHGLDASVNKVMRMLEKVVSSPIRRKGKSKSAFKDDAENNSRDSEIVDYELPDVQMELDADLADNVSESESVLPETRLLDYKRRKKAFKSIDGSEMPSKRRKIFRPAFVEKTFTSEDNTRFIDDSVSEKVVLESSEKVDAAIKSVDINMLPTNYEKTSAAKDDDNSTKKDDAFMKSMLSTSHESSPDDSKSTKALLESSKKVATSIKYIDIDILPTSHEITPSKDVSNSTEAVLESSEKVDAIEVCSEVEKAGKSEKRPVLDFFVEVSPVASVKDDQKMCGWIEW